MSHASTLKDQILVLQIASIVWALGWVVGGSVIALTLLITTIPHGGPLGLMRSLKE